MYIFALTSMVNISHDSMVLFISKKSIAILTQYYTTPLPFHSKINRYSALFSSISETKVC